MPIYVVEISLYYAVEWLYAVYEAVHYENILNILTTKNWTFSDKNSDISHTSGQNIDCGYSLEPPRQGGSNEYHNLCFWAEIWKILFTPVNPSFTI